MAECLISCCSTLSALWLGSASDCGLCWGQLFLEFVGSLRSQLSSGLLLTAPFLIRLALDVVSGWETQAAEGIAGVGLGFNVYEGRAIACCHQVVDGPHVNEDLSDLAHLISLDLPKKYRLFWVEALDG